MKDTFISAIHNKKIVRITFYSKEDNSNIVRRCAPMDFGPSRRAKDKSDRYHYWDYDSDKERHPLSLLPNQIVDLVVLDLDFNPAEFITWDTDKYPWFIKRDWQEFS